MVKNKRANHINMLLVSITLLFVLLIISFPKTSVESARNGINLWFNIVFPSLLPFLIANEILIGLGFVNFIGTLLEPFMRKIFNVPGAGSFGIAMGFMCGYPTGAKITKDLREKNLCTKIEGERLLTFTNNSGPLFIIGAVSVGMFNNPDLGIVLALAHYCAAITVGFLFRWYNSPPVPISSHIKKSVGSKTGELISPSQNIIIQALKEMLKAKRNDGRNFGTLLGDAIKNSINLLFMIGGFIIIFSVILSLLNQLNVITSVAQFISTLLGTNVSYIQSIISGILEITNGTKLASTAECDYINRISATSFILGWAGLSVHMQVISIISKTDLSYVPYLIGKFLQGIISAVYSVILFKVLLLSPVTSVFNNNTHLQYSWNNRLLYSFEILIFSLIVLILFGIIANCLSKEQC